MERKIFSQKVAKPTWIPALLWAMLGLFLFIGADHIGKYIYLNTTHSMPLGLYFSSNASPKKGDMLLLKMDESRKKFTSERGYLSEDATLLKRAVALNNDQVCFEKDYVLINSDARFAVRKRDSLGRDLPQLQLCRQLKSGEFFVLGDNLDQSLDSRYLGIFEQSQIIAVAKPLLTLTKSASFFSSKWPIF